jgi:murein DD-endopeptidase MepM/ murein hydrolase activator NlpD
MTAAKRNDLNWFPHFNDSSGVPDDSPQAVPLGNIVYFTLTFINHSQIVASARGAGRGCGEAGALYRFNDIGDVQSGGAAALKLDARPRRMAKAQLVSDLGRNIGSPEWLRGFAVCAGLCGAAYLLAPSFDPLLAAAPAPLSHAHWEEARALSIAPLAYGADTGRRLAPTAAVQVLNDTPERPSIDLLASLAPADGFARALRRAGASAADADQAASLVGSAMPLSNVSFGTTANITLGRRANKSVDRPLDLLAFRAAFDLKIEVRRMAGALVLSRIPIAVDNTPLRFQARVGTSLYRSARAAGVPTSAVETYIKVLASQIDLDAIRPDDRIDVVLAHRRAATGESETGQLLLAGLQRGSSSRLQLMPWTENGKTQWFEASGVGRSSGMFQRPVPGVVSSNFGPRMHPILGYTRMHKGLDFRAGYGTPILAAASGRVVRAGWAGGYGQQVRIDHGGPYATSYSHMSRMAVAWGQYVRQGQVIGYVGSTGLATGPHLHYELYYNGQQINPASASYIQRAQLSGPALASFRSKLRSLLNVPVTVGATPETKIAEATALGRPARI